MEHGRRPLREICRRDVSEETLGHTLAVVEERGLGSAQAQQILDMLVLRVIEDKCWGAGDLAGAQEWKRGQDSFISKQRFQRITGEAEPLTLKMTAEAAQSIP